MPVKPVRLYYRPLHLFSGNSQKMNVSNIAVFALMGISVLLTGCGGGDGGSGSGGGGNSGPQSTAEGVYGGALTGSDFNHFQSMVLENGDFWTLYGEDYGSVFYVYGFVHGRGSSSNGTFSASSVKDYGYSPPITGNATATYNATAKTLVGSVNFGEYGTVQFNGGPIPGSLYNYAATPAMSQISGSWAASDSYGVAYAFTVTSGGTVTATAGSCTRTGTIAPRPSGKNVFNVTLNAGNSFCYLASDTLSGIAIVYPLASGQTQMMGAVTNAAKTAGFAVFGVR